MDSVMDFFLYDESSVEFMDTDGDGVIDSISGMAEVNGQVVPFMAFDTDANGIFDAFTMTMDADGDGFDDTLLVGRDYDQDGTADNVKVFQDTNGTGDFDTVINIHNDNSDPNVAYRYEVDVDFNGDHQPDQHYEDVIPADSPYLNHGYADYFSLGSAQADGRFDPDTPSEYVAGTPAEDMEVWECQGHTNRCALFAQKFAIEQLTGQDIDIEEFAAIAKENGWFTEQGGTNGLNMDKMLQYYGIDHDVTYDADMQDLETALRNGEKVIVSVDSDQIWYGTDNDIFSPGTSSDHALQVIGIDYSDPDAPMVILNDSGSPAGCGEMVPLETFEAAWSTGDHQMIVCRA